MMMLDSRDKRRARKHTFIAFKLFLTNMFSNSGLLVQREHSPVEENSGVEKYTDISSLFMSKNHYRVLNSKEALAFLASCWSRLVQEEVNTIHQFILSFPYTGQQMCSILMLAYDTVNTSTGCHLEISHMTCHECEMESWDKVVRWTFVGSLGSHGTLPVNQV